MSILSWNSKLMASDTAASLNKLTCAEIMWTLLKITADLNDFRDPKTTPITRILNPMFPKKWPQRRPIGRKITMGETDFNQFLTLKNQLVFTAENYWREESLCPVHYLRI